MSTKWQFFLGGLFAGIILSGFLFLLISRPNKPGVYTIQITKNIPESTGSINSSSLSNQGKININTAPIEELASLPGIGPSKAEAIIDFRETYGPYENINELLYVPGIGESVFSSIIEYVIVE